MGNKKQRVQGPPTKEQQIDDFLRLMSHIETSGGKNLKHKRTPQGDLAYGEHGIMPRTAREMANRMRLSGTADAMDKQIRTANDDAVTYAMKNDPILERKYVEAVADKLLKDTKGDVDLMATGWRWGHNASPETLQDELDKRPGYLNKIRETQDILNKEIEQQENIKPEEFLNLKNLLRGK